MMNKVIKTLLKMNKVIKTVLKLCLVLPLIMLMLVLASIGYLWNTVEAKVKGGFNYD
jgi:hypothetical protein